MHMDRHVWRVVAIGAVGAIGVVVVYFFDPVHGADRRRRTADWIARSAKALIEASLPRRHDVSAPAVVEQELARQLPAGDRELRVPEADAILTAGETVRVHEIYSLADDLRQAAAASRPSEPETVQPAGRHRSFVPAATLGALAILAAIAAVALGSWAFLRDDETPSVGSTASDELTAVNQALTLLAEPTATRIPVRGSRGHLVLVVGADGRAFLIVAGLGSAPPGRTYQAWVIGASGSVQSAGTFSGIQRVVPLGKLVPRGATVAVTIERMRGAPAPTMKPIYTAPRS
jgi:hypothetical protein